jgi:starch synthase (maltosyl-transferring)
MTDFSGIKRVVIRNVLPRVEEGSYPAKAILNESFTISADIFADGHDELAACILIKYKQDKQWSELPLRLVENDRWEIKFEPQKLGTYQFQVMAWIDHLSTWKKGLIKKYEAAQDISVELQIGVQITEAAFGRATTKDKAIINQWVKQLKDGDKQQAIDAAISNGLSELVRKYRDKNVVTVFPKIFEVQIDRKKAEFSAWYELFPRSASPEPGVHGTFPDVQKLLPAIVAMGFDVLYLPPIHPIGEKNRKGRNNSLKAAAGDPGSPWAIGNSSGGHKSVHPQLGTLAAFKALVNEGKKLGIEIAMDLAYQCAPDHPYVTQHPEWFKWRPDGTVQYAENPPKKYEDIVPVNFETEDWQALWEELKSIVEYWIDKGVEIFRVDNPHTKSFGFWEWMIREIKKEYPQVLFLAEAFTRPRLMERLAEEGFTQSYTYFTWRNTKAELEEYVTELVTTDMKYYFRPNFWPNTPDILTEELVNGKENAHIIRLLLAATLSSNYGIYGPAFELGIDTPMQGKEEYGDNEKYEIKNWDWQRYTKIKEVIVRMNRIRKQNSALQYTTNIEFAETTNEHIICYVKADMAQENVIIVAVNLDPFQTQSAVVKVPLYKFGLKPDNPFRVRDLLSGDRYRWTEDWNYVELNPNDLPAHVLRIEQLNSLAE